MNKTYEIFAGEELKIAELIQQRRLQILVHSCIYYALNKNIISDATWDKWARELVQLQKDYPKIAQEVIWAKDFEDFDGSTGFDLPIHDEWVMMKAKQLCRNKPKEKKPIVKKGRLF